MGRDGPGRQIPHAVHVRWGDPVNLVDPDGRQIRCANSNLACRRLNAFGAAIDRAVNDGVHKVQQAASDVADYVTGVGIAVSEGLQAVSGKGFWRGAGMTAGGRFMVLGGSGMTVFPEPATSAGGPGIVSAGTSLMSAGITTMEVSSQVHAAAGVSSTVFKAADAGMGNRSFQSVG